MNLRKATIVAIALVACRPQSQTSPAPAHGATDVGTPQTLSNDRRYVPAADRRPGVFPDAWRHKAGRAPVMSFDL